MLALLWMLVGIYFYSFSIGNISNIIAAMDSKMAAVNAKLTTIHEYCVKHNLPKMTEFKIRRYVETHQQKNDIDLNWEILYDSLPLVLKNEIV